MTIVYDDGSDPVRAAQAATGADVVVMVVGYTDRDEGEYVSPDSMAELSKNFPIPTPEEMPLAQAMMSNMGAANSVPNAMPPGGDRKQLTLHPEDELLIQAVSVANPRTVVAMMGGSAIITEAWRNQVPAILMLWYPGMEGGHAFADILLGKVNPSGKLPCIFAVRAEDLPSYDMNAKAITYDLWHGYRKLEHDGAAPAFPFGFGLSYTKFEFTNLRLTGTVLGTRDTLTATIDVTNLGSVSGDTVVQGYISVSGSRVERAPRELKAFQRVNLRPGEKKSVQLEIPMNDLAYYDPESGWTVEPVAYKLIVGQHSLDDKSLQAAFEYRIE